MSHSIVHVSGPAGAGKTLLIRELSRRFGADRIYHIRVDLSNGDAPSMLRVVSPAEQSDRVMHCYVRPEFVFESFAEMLPSIAPPQERALVFVETGASPCFRHAFPYDAKVFVMCSPGSLEDIFRSPEETAGAINRAMHDTAEFAAELFGLDRLSAHDSALLPSLDIRDSQELEQDQSVDDFLGSPMGIEISARMHLRPEFQGVIDADVVFLNNAIRPNMYMEKACVSRIQDLLDRLRSQSDRRSWFAACDPIDERDSNTSRGWRLLAEILSTAKTEAT